DHSNCLPQCRRPRGWRPAAKHRTPRGQCHRDNKRLPVDGRQMVELLKEAAPHTARIALIFVPGIVVENYFAAIDPAAEVLGLQAIQTPYRNSAELERAIDAFAAEPNGGLVMVPPPPSGSARELINRLALKYRLPP